MRLVRLGRGREAERSRVEEHAAARVYGEAAGEETFQRVRRRVEVVDVDPGVERLHSVAGAGFESLAVVGRGKVPYVRLAHVDVPQSELQKILDATKFLRFVGELSGGCHGQLFLACFKDAYYAMRIRKTRETSSADENVRGEFGPIVRSVRDDVFHARECKSIRKTHTIVTMNPKKTSRLRRYGRKASETRRRYVTYGTPPTSRFSARVLRRATS